MNEPAPATAQINRIFITDQHGVIESHHLDLVDRFPPSQEFAAQANCTADVYRQAEADPEAFWADRARALHWHKPFTRTLDWSSPPFAKWFDDGEINASYNALDRHVIAGNGDRVALHWEGEPGDRRTITYAQLLAEVKRAANVLTALGIGQGDRVAVYLPMIPETVATLLAIARVGAIHSVIFGGFSADSLRARIDDCEARLVVTADGGWRKGRVSPLKPTVDAALGLHPERRHSVEHVLVVRRGENDVDWTDGRDLWWHDTVATASAEHEAQGFPAENPLFILYTSGTTGRPKGILHTTGGYLTQTSFTHRVVFDLKPETDVFWCTADVGWITGHSYLVYGPLVNGATQVMYEGTPETPTWGRWWQIVERYGVTTLYTAPTAIRAFMRVGRQVVLDHDLSSIRLLGSVGEPINPEAWLWYREVVGSNAAPIVDTWWQTETGAIMASPLPGVTTMKPGSAQKAVPGVSLGVVDDSGAPVGNGNGGLLVANRPWPSMLRGIWGDDRRYVDTYLATFGDRYFAGDGARYDDDGDIWLLGRVDDVMNVSGRRLSTAEIESALVGHHAVAEAGVVGVSDENTGEAVIAFVVLKRNQQLVSTADAPAELRQHVAQQIGAIARPKRVYIVNDLPKTRSGKIIRRVLRDLAEGRPIGDTTTVADPKVITSIAEQVQATNG